MIPVFYQDQLMGHLDNGMINFLPTYHVFVQELALIPLDDPPQPKIHKIILVSFETGMRRLDGTPTWLDVRSLNGLLLVPGFTPIEREI